MTCVGMILKQSHWNCNSNEVHSSNDLYRSTRSKICFSYITVITVMLMTRTFLRFVQSQTSSEWVTQRKQCLVQRIAWENSWSTSLLLVKPQLKDASSCLLEAQSLTNFFVVHGTYSCSPELHIA